MSGSNLTNILIYALSFVLFYGIFFMLFRNAKIIRLAGQKKVIGIACIIIALALVLFLMSTIRSNNIKGVSYNLLNGILTGIYVSFTVIMLSYIKRV